MAPRSSAAFQSGSNDGWSRFFDSMWLPICTPGSLREERVGDGDGGVDNECGSRAQTLTKGWICIKRESPQRARERERRRRRKRKGKRLRQKGIMPWVLAIQYSKLALDSLLLEFFVAPGEL